MLKDRALSSDSWHDFPTFITRQGLLISYLLKESVRASENQILIGYFVPCSVVTLIPM